MMLSRIFIYKFLLTIDIKICHLTTLPIIRLQHKVMYSYIVLIAIFQISFIKDFIILSNTNK